ncbi:SMP-30/gluconolactonase/LRE family protein [Oceaniglobus indicus]|uniref:SMP-30/gluconolactonase/LRE family protein n=1 Tax=Oceaniglobus indicus TaxID=2047749 RepID=UPI000C19ECE9|nr:SMP-30/gluconolactonase/LRE family protein [Oceaniglobus indicus]
MSIAVFDPTPCALGEGPLWHPEREQLFWFDIIGKRLLTRDGDAARHWQFDEHVSAGGWIDRDTLLIASETALSRFDLVSGKSTALCALDADSQTTRSNDGRADPQGGFWIGTMAKDETPGAGAIHRFYRGELRRLFAGISIPNAICFPPDGAAACYADTAMRKVMSVTLDSDGWPTGDPRVAVDLTADALNPDGAVIDTDGNIWIAQWGAGRVACHAPDGSFLHAIDVPAAQTTCPALAPDGTLYITSAARGDDGPCAGQTFAIATTARGQPEHRITL